MPRKAQDSTDRNTLLGQARSEAVTALIEENRERFTALYVQKAKDKGVEYTPRPSKEEREAAAAQEKQRKAKEQLDRLLEKHPELRDTFAPQAEGSNLVDQDEDTAATA